MTTTCILSGVLGNRIISSRLAESVDRVIGNAERIWFDHTSYAAYPAPPLLRRFSAIESELVARRMLANHRRPRIAIVNGYTIAMATRAKSLVVATDATPAMISRMRQSPDLPRRILGRIQDVRFRRFAKTVAAWLPISNTARDSLVNDYGVDPDRCFVTRAPQPVIDQSSVRTKIDAPAELLFVGNDFVRKGGETLLEVFRQRLLSNCLLTIISNDPALNNVSIDGVQIVKGINDPAQISAIYRRASLLMLPTTYDMYSNVICEGLAHGLPFLSTRVGGVGELIDESGAGAELPTDPSPDAIARCVAEALSDEGAYLKRSANAVRYAVSHLSMHALDEMVRRSISSLPN